MAMTQRGSKEISDMCSRNSRILTWENEGLKAGLCTAGKWCNRCGQLGQGGRKTENSAIPFDRQEHWLFLSRMRKYHHLKKWINLFGKNKRIAVWPEGTSQSTVRPTFSLVAVGTSFQILYSRVRLTTTDWDNSRCLKIYIPGNDTLPVHLERYGVLPVHLERYGVTRGCNLGCWEIHSLVPWTYAGDIRGIIPPLGGCSS